MAVYYINLALIFILAVPLCIIKPKKWKNILYLAITFIYLWALATFRKNIGFDYESYINIFEQVRTAGTVDALLALNLEPGFLVLNKFMALFVHDSVVMYGVYEVLILVPVALFIYKHCKDIWISVWLYVTLTFYYNSLNFIRQSLACSIILLGYKFLKEKKAVPFLVIVLIAALFHKTALIMVPVYFLCHIRPGKKMAIFYASATLLLYLTSQLILDVVTNYIFSQYKDTIWLQGFPIYFVMVPTVIFGSCLALYPIWKTRDAQAPMLLNLMMFSAIIWLFITRHMIIERFSMYVYITVLIAMPAALSCLKASDEVVAKRDNLKTELSHKKNPGKEMTASLAALNQKISDGQKYYWCAVAALMIITLIYHEFGANVNNFHGVFPYQSVFD
jgi:hypothetical protein